ncbi:MAG: protein translocase subunit SecF [Alphaproteobacteria bacterium]|nr:protein translocase subunit SecF [Alphaproteobacteria bacterium]
MFRILPDSPQIEFMRWRLIFFAFSAVLMTASLGFYFVQGLNFGIDFKGGVLIEVRTPGPADLGAMRAKLGDLGLGEVALQEFGEPTDVLIRVQKQEGGEEAQQRAIEILRAALGQEVEYRRVEFVGPKVGGELIMAGTTAVLLAIAAMLIYIWFRFEWQFGVGAVLALVHDVTATIGIFSVFQLEFNLSTVAAILTIAGYSINDTVVIYDRVRENLRKYKRMPLEELFNRSINETLSRTIRTSVTTLLALLALYFFGGEVIAGFSFAMIFGVLVGTYSSICIAVPLILYMSLRRDSGEGGSSKVEETA